MFLLIQPQLVEQAVFQSVRKDATASRAYHLEFARSYSEDEDRRDDAFRAMHERWFERLGFRNRVEAIIEEFPQITRHVTRVVIAPAGGRGGQSAELFGAPGSYSVVLTMSVATILDETAFSYWARYELMHIDDMLDRDFLYDPTAGPGGASSAAHNLVRDRYALLWAMSIDARLLTIGKGTNDVVDRRRKELGRAFGIHEPAILNCLFDRLWAQLKQRRPTNPELISWSSGDLPGLAVTECETTHTPLPGSPCPLCKFSTFDWADTEMLSLVAPSLASDFPDWRSVDGACRRCVEIYQGRVPLAGVADKFAAGPAK